MENIFSCRSNKVNIFFMILKGDVLIFGENINKEVRYVRDY